MKHRVAHSSEVLEGQPVPAEAGGHKVLLVRSTGGLFALENACPHQRNTLEKGEVLAHSIRCPLHGVEVSLSDGTVVEDVGFLGLSPVQVFSVEETEGMIYLDI